eukprot:CAMPEP_0177233876 /NCGR_PEP_ID=MMETSP0367-20130122/44098_1 /TAXON_ID=447022 ORGANISM="Scrippsiella hangoei-like, Strain SHHI-4" /NCGR_SAMPLE_ID=MMETSP0367 /ASSEMBLY_ACC=CAM_ASM_000362 /LENGTH=128 /DNA_ID=CAMNT_0018684635 /DNA_START=43 /DNA_END=429 /DNA_ORIENTATION=-
MATTASGLLQQRPRRRVLHLVLTATENPLRTSQATVCSGIVDRTIAIRNMFTETHDGGEGILLPPFLHENLLVANQVRQVRASPCGEVLHVRPDHVDEVQLDAPQKRHDGAVDCAGHSTSEGTANSLH